MPISLPTLFGKADYNVTRAIELVAAAVDSLEENVRALQHHDPAADLRRLDQEVRALRDRVDDLAQRVRTLEQAP